MAEEGGILMISEKPYFMQNKEWYYFDELEFKYKLTEKAPQKAIESYKEYYRDVYDGDES
jgi:hypothetical protein